MRVICHLSLGEIEPARWEDLWRRAPQANVYQTQAWYAAYERHLAAPGSLRILVAEENGRWIGAAALEITEQSIGPVRRRILTPMSSRSAVYPLDQGPLLDRERGDSALEALARAIAAMDGVTAFHCARFEGAVVMHPLRNLPFALVSRAHRRLKPRLAALAAARSGDAAS